MSVPVPLGPHLRLPVLRPVQKRQAQRQRPYRRQGLRRALSLNPILLPVCRRMLAPVRLAPMMLVQRLAQVQPPVLELASVQRLEEASPPA